MRLFSISLLFLGLISFLIIFLPMAGMFANTSFKEILDLFADMEVMESILLTFECAFYATVFAIIFGTPLAYIIARYKFRGRKIIEVIMELPIMIPHTAAGIALLVIFGSGPLGEFFKSIGLDIMGTKLGIVLGMGFASIPFYIDSVKDGFASIDPRIENVARTLGANKRQVFFKIMLPMVTRSIFTGSTLMWGRGISEFGAVVIIAYHPMVAPVLIYERFTSFGLQNSRPIAVLLITMCVGLFFIFKILTGIGIYKSDKD
jgi:molybdate/tungstate transport system permease protein